MDSSSVIHLLLKLFKGILNNLSNIRSDIHISKFILNSFRIRKLIKLRSQVIFIKIITSFTFFNLLMNFIFHLINSIMIIRYFKWSSHNFKGFKIIIYLTISEVNLSNKFLEFLRILKFNIKILSIHS